MEENIDNIEDITIPQEDINWYLDTLSISFKKGYSFDKSCDRYEGYIQFKNKAQESFRFNITEELSNEYIKLIADDITKNAKALGERLIVNIKDQLNKSK